MNLAELMVMMAEKIQTKSALPESSSEPPLKSNGVCSHAHDHDKLPNFPHWADISAGALARWAKICEHHGIPTGDSHIYAVLNRLGYGITRRNAQRVSRVRRGLSPWPRPTPDEQEVWARLDREQDPSKPGSGS